MLFLSHILARIANAYMKQWLAETMKLIIISLQANREYSNWPTKNAWHKVLLRFAGFSLRGSPNFYNCCAKWVEVINWLKTYHPPRILDVRRLQSNQSKWIQIAYPSCNPIFYWSAQLIMMWYSINVKVFTLNKAAKNSSDKHDSISNIQRTFNFIFPGAVSNTIILWRHPLMLLWWLR
jgi:hypothetical protein